MTTGLTTGLTSLDLFNELQSRKNWPHGGPPLVLDLRSVESFSERRIRGSHHAVVGEDGVLTTPERAAWAGRTVVLVADDTEQASAAAASLRGAGAKRPLFLAEPFAAFAAARPFLTAAGSSSKAGKRPPAYPSCILPGLLYLGDIEDAVALPRLKEHLGVTHAITALADPPASLKAAVREAGVRHLWCAVRDVAAADIKEHFDKARAPSSHRPRRALLCPLLAAAPSRPHPSLLEPHPPLRLATSSPTRRRAEAPSSSTALAASPAPPRSSSPS